ncbi:MAG TPA: hypothetical protein VGQ55_08690 [Pyrinomonadaceae bacterium]|jgi:hypothetical protein|nr:hypothetical protein [Pyrinomonadaceae bacterium]
MKWVENTSRKLYARHTDFSGMEKVESTLLVAMNKEGWRFVSALKLPKSIQYFFERDKA